MSFKAAAKSKEEAKSKEDMGKSSIISKYSRLFSLSGAKAVSYTHL